MLMGIIQFERDEIIEGTKPRTELDGFMFD